MNFCMQISYTKTKIHTSKILLFPCKNKQFDKNQTIYKSHSNLGAKMHHFRFSENFGIFSTMCHKHHKYVNTKRGLERTLKNARHIILRLYWNFDFDNPPP